MADNYYRAILNNQIIVSAVDSKDIVNKAIQLHSLSPISADALGRVLTVAALMGQTLKDKEDYLTTVVNGGGILGSITACSDAVGNVKGCIDVTNAPNVYDANGNLDVKGSVGKTGKVTVIKNIGLKQPYVGTSPMVSGAIADDFANYYATSEQQPCALTVGITINKEGKCTAAGGVLVQVLPNCDAQLLDNVETTLYAMDEMSYQFQFNSAKDIVHKFFGGYDNFVESKSCSVRYHCDCSEQRFERAIVGLGQKEAQSIVDEVGFIEVTCHFCNKKYKFDKNSVDKLFVKK